jgi:hypothetical protein
LIFAVEAVRQGNVQDRLGGDRDLVEIGSGYSLALESPAVRLASKESRVAVELQLQ